MTEAHSVPSNTIAPDALLRELDGPAFAEPWMAQAFACTVHLSRRGLFTWNEWVDIIAYAQSRMRTDVGETNPRDHSHTA